MLTKKYFSISEACDMCSLAPHKLRYIDKIDKKMSIVKIRGRRYYTMENIDYLIKTYSGIDQLISKQTSPKINNTEIKNQHLIRNTDSAKQINHQFLERIDQLIKNFHALTKVLS